MNKTLLRSASMLLAIILAFGVFIPGRATSQNASLMPNRTVNLAFFYTPLSINTSTATSQKKWSYGSTLATGTYKLKLVFVSPSGGKASLDAVSIP